MKNIIAIVFGFFLGTLALWAGEVMYSILAIAVIVFFFVNKKSSLPHQNWSLFYLKILIITLPYPVLFSAMGRDAITITTIGIFLFALLMLVGMWSRNNDERQPVEVFNLIPLAMMVCFTVTVSTNFHFWGQEIRYYLANISGIILYLIIIKCINHVAQLRQAVFILICTVASQACVAGLQLYAPGLAAHICTLFATRTNVPQAILEEGFLRAAGTVGDYELLANWFLISALWGIGLTYTQKDWKIVALVSVLFLGILATGTRSAFILFPVGFLAITFLVMSFVPSWRKVALILFCFGLITCVLGVLFGQNMGDIWIRLEDYLNSRNLIDPSAINRKDVWDMAINQFLSRITFWGHGFHNVELEYSWGISFHSLYFTILYKQGLLGMILHLMFWLYLLMQSIKALRVSRRDDERGLVIISITAVFFLLIDGIKVEYLRYAHTIQFAWMIYAFNVSACRIACNWQGQGAPSFDAGNGSAILYSNRPSRKMHSLYQSGWNKGRAAQSRATLR